jgi:hypothetical protein
MRSIARAVALGVSVLCTLAAALRLSAQVAPADPVARLLTDLETALASGDPTRLTALEAPALSPDTVNGIARSVVSGPNTSVAVRERTRRVTGAGADVLADVFLGRGNRARVVTWRIKTQAAAGGGPQVIAGLDEQGALDDLLKLTLDPSRQFAVHNLDVRATDLTLHMPSGQAFVAETEDGVTAIVLHGRGEVRFAPSDRAEQGQLQVFAHQSELVVETSDAFIRINPAEFTKRVAQGALLPEAVSPDALATAQTIFDEFAPLTYGIDLRDLGQRGWSFEPRAGNVVVEFKTGRFGWLTYALSPGELEDVTLFKRSGSKLISSYASPERIATRGKFYNENANATYRVEHYDLDVTFDPLRRAINGRAVMRLRVMTDAVNSLTLRLNDDLVVSSVTAPGAERLLAVRLTSQQRLLVSLPGALPRDTLVTIEVAYAGRLAASNFDREAMDGGQLTAQEIEPRVDFRPDPERVLIYSGRSAWYPQAETLDHSTANIRVHVPADFDVVASGTQTRSTVAAPSSIGPGERTVDFAADRPVRYLACAITHLAPIGTAQALVPGLAPPSSSGTSAARRPSGTSGGPASIDVNVLATPKAVSQSRTLAARASDMVRFYSTLVGEAPYGSLTVAALDDNVPGGHSPAYLTLIRIRLPTSPFNWRSDPVAFTQVGSFLLAHEVAHQWWGQAVGWENYHEQWLSEGLAQYFAVLYTGSVQGAETARSLLASMRSSVLDMRVAGPISLGNRLGHLTDDPSMFRVILYNKSAVVLDMLRRLIGDKAFYGGLASFYRDHRFAAAGTDDLTRAFQAGTDIPIERFFDTWVLNSGIPEARVRTELDGTGLTATVHVEPLNFPADYPLTLTVQYVDGSSDEITIPVVGGSLDRKVSLKAPARGLVAKDDVLLVKIK